MENSIGVETTMSNPIGSNALLKALKPILRMKRFSGRSFSWSSKDQPKYVRWINTITDLVITVLTVGYPIHCSYNFFRRELNISQFLVGIVLMLNYLGASCLCFINIIVQFTSHDNLIRHVKAYQVISDRALFAHIEKINCRLLWVFLITLIAIVILISTLFLTAVFPKESVLVHFLMFPYHDDEIFTIGVFSFALVSFFIGIGQLCDFWILAFFCRVFSWEFRSLHVKWLKPGSKALNDADRNWYQEIDAFRREYELVVGLLKAVEHTFRFDLLLYFGIIVPVTCVFIYTILRPEDFETADLVVIHIIACVIAVQCCFFIFVGMKIHSSAHELTEDLYNVDMTNMPSDVISKLSIFLTRLTASPIGISVAGLFIIDNSTILMLAGTLLTYVVVVIQTKPTNNTFNLPENCTLA